VWEKKGKKKMRKDRHESMSGHRGTMIMYAQGERGNGGEKLTEVALVECVFFEVKLQSTKVRGRGKRGEKEEHEWESAHISNNRSSNDLLRMF